MKIALKINQFLSKHISKANKQAKKSHEKKNVWVNKKTIISLHFSERRWWKSEPKTQEKERENFTHEHNFNCATGEEK